MLKRRISKSMPWTYNLAVELAMRLQDLLEPNEEYPPYEFLPEAVGVIDRLIKDGLEADVSAVVSAIMSDSLDYAYPAEVFESLEPFLQQRLGWLRRYSTSSSESPQVAN
jgi:hypothetical protein